MFELNMFEICSLIAMNLKFTLTSFEIFTYTRMHELHYFFYQKNQT